MLIWQALFLCGQIQTRPHRQIYWRHWGLNHLHKRCRFKPLVC